NLMKSLASDLDYKREHQLGAVNSVNFGRVSAQMVYYFWAWLRYTDGLPVDQRSNAEISVTVPSGNFGNLYSGHLAKSMGAPIRHLVLAANQNDVLYEFFRAWVYTPRSAAETFATSSPSMDISKASNLDRFVFDVLARDPERLAAVWRDLDRTG